MLRISCEVFVVVVAPTLVFTTTTAKANNKQCRRKEWPFFHLGLERSCGVVLAGKRIGNMAAQRAQNYLDIHKIGPLFEEMMATLIKDMPNEPIQYLIRMLQKADQKLRSPRGISAHDRSKSASTSGLSKHGIGVSGHPAPKRSIEEPHRALPGGGKGAAAWGSTSLSASHGRPASAEPKKRGYEKPWLSKSSSKPPSHSETKKAERPASSKKKELWNKDTKTKSKDFDEMSEQTRAKPLSPTNVEKGKQVPYEGVKTWASGEENVPPQPADIIIQGKARIVLDSHDEIDINDIEMEKAKEKTDLTEISKKHATRGNPSSRAAQKRMKLQALLHEQEKPSKMSDDDDDESGDETVEVLEQADDLLDEGVENATSSGSKLKTRPRDEESNVQIKICAHCAKVITGAGFSDTDSEVSQQQRPRMSFSDIAPTEGDFESVSQIGDARSQKWPSIKEDEPNEASSQIYRPAESATSAGRTDFFNANAPMRGHQQQADIADSEVESHVSSGPGGQAWAVKPAESASGVE